MIRQLPIVTIIQTRSGSSRLPGKVLMPLAGKPMFVQQVKRMQAAVFCGSIIVATTTDSADDVIEKICTEEGFICFRGSPTDLLDRHYKAAKYYDASIVVKVPSDCPLIDPAIVDEVIGCYKEHDKQYDYVSNLHPASWPDGNDVEVMSISVLEEAWQNADRFFEREHTTPYIWERPEKYRIGNVIAPGGEDYSMDYRFTIDYLEDYFFIRAVYNELYTNNPLFTCNDILDLIRKRKDIFYINHRFAGVNWYRHHLGELRTVTTLQTRQIESSI